MKNEFDVVYFLHIQQLKRVGALHLQTLFPASMHNSFFFKPFEDFGSNLKVLNCILAFALPNHVAW